MNDPAATIDEEPAAAPAQPDLSKNPAFASALGRLKSAGIAEQKPWMDMAKEIEYFGYSPDYNKRLYDEWDGGELAFKAKINRASEFVEVVGPYLFPKCPDASVNTFPWARYWQRKRNKVEEDYADYAFRTGDLQGEARKMTTDACLSGRGCLATGFNERKGVVQNVHRSSKDLILDPDAKSDEELNWIMVKRQKPKWELKEIIKGIRGDDTMDSVIDALKYSTETKTAQSDSTGEMADYWEVYMRVGLGRYCKDDNIDEEDGKAVIDDSPRKYLFTGDKILAATEWEIPFFLIDEWPVSWVDLRPVPGKIYGAAPLEPGLGHLKALNWIYTFYINRVRVTSRTFLISAEYNGQGVEDDQFMKVVKGEDMDVLRLKINGNELKIQDVIQQFKFDSGIEELDRFVALVGKEFEKATGLSEVLYSGEGQRQSRIKADVDFKEKQSKNRIEDMRGRIIGFMTRTMRKTLFAARYLKAPADVEPILGAEAAAVWGTLASPDQVAQEQAMRKQAAQQIMAQAQQQQAMYQQFAASMPPPPMPMPGQAPMPAQAMPPPPVMPTPDDIQKQLGPEQLVSMDEWIHEASREVEAGSMEPIDHDAKIDQLNAILTQMAPIIGPMPGGAQFLATAVLEITQINRYSDDLQKSAQDMLKQCLMIPGPGDAGPAVPTPAAPAPQE